jgi:tetratricopeptide (TPR) repeat protein
MYDRAVAFGQDGKFADARDLLRKALAASPGNLAIISCLTFAEDGAAVRISADLGKLLFASTASGNRGDWNTSLSLAQKAAKDGPKYAPAHLHLGVVYVQLVRSGRGDHYVQDAIAAYQEAIRIKPDYTQAFFNLGVAYAATGKWQLARTQLQRAKELAQAQNDSVLLDHCDRMLSQIAGRN